MLALNGDELLDLDYPALVAEHEQSGAAATIVVAQVRSPFGVVDLGRTARSQASARRRCSSTGSTPASTCSAKRRSSGCPSVATTSTTFPELAAEGKLRGHRHTGVWLTVNTPKELRRAAEFMEEHPEWKPQRQLV